MYKEFNRKKETYLFNVYKYFKLCVMSMSYYAGYIVTYAGLELLVG